MAKISKKMMLFGLVSFFCLGGFAAGQKIADRSKPTGLKPIDAAQVEKIQKNWQRINKIHLNQLGLERVNEVRAKKGQPPLAPSVVRPLGRDLDSEIIREREGMLFAPPRPGTRSSGTSRPSWTTACCRISLPSGTKAGSIPALPSPRPTPNSPT